MNMASNALGTAVASTPLNYLSSGEMNETDHKRRAQRYPGVYAAQYQNPGGFAQFSQMGGSNPMAGQQQQVQQAQIQQLLMDGMRYQRLRQVAQMVIERLPQIYQYAQPFLNQVWQQATQMTTQQQQQSSTSSSNMGSGTGSSSSGMGSGISSGLANGMQSGVTSSSSAQRPVPSESGSFGSAMTSALGSLGGQNTQTGPFSSMNPGK